MIDSTLHPGPGKGWVNCASPRPLYPRESDLAPIVAGGIFVSGAGRRMVVWKISPATEVLTLDRPARNESLYACQKTCMKYGSCY